MAFDFNAYRREWRKRPDVQRRTFNDHLRRKYGITVEKYEAMLKDQGGCAICGRTDTGVSNQDKLHVDHVHGLKLVRGILCKDCNTGLGMFKDTPELLIKAAEYLLGNEEVEGER